MRIRTKLFTFICLLVCCSAANALSCRSPSEWESEKEAVVREVYKWSDAVALLESGDPGLLAPQTAMVVALWKGQLYTTVVSSDLPMFHAGQRSIWFAWQSRGWRWYDNVGYCTRWGLTDDELEYFVRNIYGEPTIKPTAFWLFADTATYSVFFVVLLLSSLGTLFAVTRGINSSPAVVGIRILRRHGARAG